MRWLVAFAAIAACSSNHPAMPDAATDGAADVCVTCRADQICVASYDGVCKANVGCVPRTVDCPANACTADCEAAYCGSPPYQCQTRTTCGGESPLAFTCYGP